MATSFSGKHILILDLFPSLGADLKFCLEREGVSVSLINILDLGEFFQEDNKVDAIVVLGSSYLVPIMKTIAQVKRLDSNILTAFYSPSIDAISTVREYGAFDLILPSMSTLDTLIEALVGGLYSQAIG